MFCSACGSVQNLNNCGQCKNIAYCSETCQRDDWFLHQKACIGDEIVQREIYVVLGRNTESSSLLKPKAGGNTFILPKVGLFPSTIPEAGLGLFALEDISKREPITVYGGEVVSDDAAKALRLTNNNTHLQTLLRNTLHIDGRLQPEKGFTKTYFAFYNNLGSFAKNPVRVNTKENRELVNANFEKFETPLNYEPYHTPPTPLYPEGQTMPVQIMLVATRNIRAGEEIFVRYGAAYWRDFD